MSWCTIESDPGVFTEMISSLGVPNVSVEEIYSLDSSEQIREPSYGLIFLFKYVSESDGRTCIDPNDIPELFFARQTTQNACATQAILSVLLNCEQIDIGPELTEFKSFAIALDSESRGMAIGGSDSIRLVHNSFARADPFFIEETKDKDEKGEAYHFVAYIPFQGRVYELDGLRRGPIALGDFSDDWLDVAKPAVEARMARYASSETSFALLSIRPQRSAALESDLAELEARLASLGLQGDEDMAAALRSEISEVKGKLAYELANLERMKQENVRRRHNYLPFAMTLLRHLSRRGQLQGLVQAAKRRQDEQLQRGGGKKSK